MNRDLEGRNPFQITDISKVTLRKKFPYSKFFWSVFSSNAEKYRPEKLQIRTLFTQRNVQ